MSEWSPERELLAVVVDRLGDVLRALVAVNGGKPPRVPPYPRPTTAWQRARNREAMRSHEALVARLKGLDGRTS